MATKDLLKLGAALLVGAALAFPIGMMVAGSQREPGRVTADRRSDATVRDVFSPSIRNDPYFLDRQREGVETLEGHCARSGTGCAEARAARARLEELQAAE